MTAKSAATLKSSFIRDILALTNRPEVISFAGGLPDPKLFPATELFNALEDAVDLDSSSSLQYGETQGLYSLRKWIGSNLSTPTLHPDQIMITSGAQQGLDLVARSLLNPGDKVIIEAPSYLGAIQTFSANEAELLTVPMTSTGPDLIALEKLISEESISLLYTIPNFQNPTGISYNRATRSALADLIGQHDIMIVEDDPYGALRYSGEPLPTLQSLLPDQTIYLGSFSKIVSPGIRVGWLTAPDSLMANLKKMKQVTDLHTSSLNQQILTHYLSQGKLSAHIDRLKAAYGNRLRTMREKLSDLLTNKVTISEPEGGMFLWLELPENLDAMNLVKDAVSQGIGFVPGVAFYPEQQGPGNTMRLNFTNAEPEEIERGVDRLAKLINRVLE